MSGSMTKNTNFEIRLNVLRHLANRYPNRVGRAELSERLIGTVRTHQRALQELADLGYVECDGCNPAGFKLVKGKFEEFQGL